MKPAPTLETALLRDHGWTEAIGYGIARLSEFGLYLDHHIRFAGRYRQGTRDGLQFAVHYSGTCYDHCTDDLLLNPRPIVGEVLFALSREKLVSAGLNRTEAVADTVNEIEHRTTRSYWLG
ncbi:hypothetical protein NKH53_26200 [Mesorhizobium australicum]|uniref:hypothetical protein n=1 Tax=Mesorhizobium australicum TaxID=536018 RepID=UPI003334EB44